MLVSIIIPCYNSENFISDCINSVINQTYKQIEIICINDGSTDSTKKILEDFKSKNSAIITVVSVKNGGAPKARNIGLNLSKGTYIQFLDADDLIAPEKIEQQLNAFNEDTSMVVSDRVCKNYNLTSTLEILTFPEVEINPLETCITKIIITGNPLYRRSSIISINGYDETLNSAQDWDFHIRLVLAGLKIKYAKGVFLTSRIVSTSLSSNWQKVSIQASFIIKSLKEKLVNNKYITDKIRNHFAQIYFDSAIYTINKSDSELFANEISYWSPNYLFIKNKNKLIIIKIIGIEYFIFFIRLIKNSFRIKSK